MGSQYGTELPDTVLTQIIIPLSNNIYFFISKQLNTTMQTYHISITFLC